MHNGGLGLLISKAEVGIYVAIANDSNKCSQTQNQNLLPQNQTVLSLINGMLFL